MQANSYTSPGTAGGNREYINDVLTILEPEDCPFVSMVRKGAAPKAVLIETLADTLRKPRTSGTREGQDAGKGGNKVKDRQRFGTRLQRIMDSYGTTDVQELISNNGGVAGGVSSEFANSKAKTLREMKRDLEAICCSTNEHYAGDESEMKTRGAFTWLEAAGVSTLQTQAPLVPTNYRPRATSATGSTTVSAVKTGASSAFTEDDLNYILQALQREHGPGKTYEAILGDVLIDKVDHFTRTGKEATQLRYTVNENASEHRITMMVKVFESSQGRCNFIPSQFLKVDSNGDPDRSCGLVLWTPHWHLDFLDNLHAVDGEETSGGRDGYAKAIFALLCDLPRGSGAIHAS